jgi:type IV pilus assembly protein PilA
MLGKINKMLRKEQGFTLVELMTVLIILGVVLGIGIPKYLQIQKMAEWQADETTIKNFAKAAETYAASIDNHGDLPMATLVEKGLIDGDIVLNRTPDGKNIKTVVGATTAAAVTGYAFIFDKETGNVTNLYTADTGIIPKLIGTKP